MDDITQLQDRLRETRRNCEKLQDQLKQAEDETAEQSDKAKRLAALNEELRELFEQERKATREEHSKLVQELEQLQQSHERKQGLLRSKLFVILSGFAMGKDINVTKESSETVSLRGGRWGILIPVLGPILRSEIFMTVESVVDFSYGLNRELRLSGALNS